MDWYRRSRKLEVTVGCFYSLPRDFPSISFHFVWFSFPPCMCHNFPVPAFLFCSPFSSFRGPLVYIRHGRLCLYFGVSVYVWFSCELWSVACLRLSEEKKYHELFLGGLVRCRYCVIYKPTLLLRCLVAVCTCCNVDLNLNPTFCTVHTRDKISVPQVHVVQIGILSGGSHFSADCS